MMTHSSKNRPAERSTLRNALKAGIVMIDEKRGEGLNRRWYES